MPGIKSIEPKPRPIREGSTTREFRSSPWSHLNRGSLIVLDKPAGPTSFDLIREIKRVLRFAEIDPLPKIGHAGSLDPFATGALILLLGKATKLSGMLLNADKRYRGVVRLGTATDSYDCTGEVIKTLPLPEGLNQEKIIDCLNSYVGEWLQTPPMFSAKKLHGVRLYELARQQINVRMQPIPVELYSMDFVKWESPDIHFEVHCSKGTYIRSLAEDIGRRLGTVAHLAELRRVSCGDFSLEDSVTVEQLRESLPMVLENGSKLYSRLLRSEVLLS